MNSRSDKEE